MTNDAIDPEEIYEYELLNPHDSLPFVAISARFRNRTFTDNIGVIMLSSGDMDLVAITFYLFAVRRIWPSLI